jgi:hypothetical protein
VFPAASISRFLLPGLNWGFAVDPPDLMPGDGGAQRDAVFRKLNALTALTIRLLPLPLLAAFELMASGWGAVGSAGGACGAAGCIGADRVRERCRDRLAVLYLLRVDLGYVGRTGPFVGRGGDGGVGGVLGFGGELVGSFPLFG